MERNKFAGAVWNRLLNFSKREALFAKGDKVLAAVSGGPDSVCLLHFLRHAAKINGFELYACHVNHGIRGKAADADAKFAAELCKTLGVRCFVKNASVPALARREGLSLEHAARKARYRALAAAAKKMKCGKIAAGHHLDDHVETIILNLLRGTRARGLTGIPVKRRLEAGSKITLARPLLCLTRREIMDYLKLNKLSYRTDETNDSEKYTRNWVRKTLLPLIEKKQPRFREHLLQISMELRDII